MGPDGCAAVVFCSDDAKGVDDDHNWTTQTKKKKTPANNPDEPARTPRLLPGRSNLTPEQIYQRMLAGHGRRINIPAQ